MHHGTSSAAPPPRADLGVASLSKGSGSSTSWLRFLAIAVTACCTAAATLCVLTLMMNSMYWIENSKPVITDLNHSLLLANWTNHSELELGNITAIVAVPDFRVSFGILYSCFDLDCVARSDHTLKPLLSGVVALMEDGALPAAIEKALLDLVNGGPLDFSIHRPQLSCASGGNQNTGTIRSLIVSLFCVGAVSSFCAVIPALWYYHHSTRFHLTCQQVLQDSKVGNARCCGSGLEPGQVILDAFRGEHFFVYLLFLFSAFSAAATVAGAALYHWLDGNLMVCGVASFCEVESTLLTTSLSAFAGDSQLDTVISCGTGSAFRCMWAAVGTTSMATLLTLSMILSYLRGHRRAFAVCVSTTISRMMAGSQRNAATHRGVQQEPLSPLSVQRLQRVVVSHIRPVSPVFSPAAERSPVQSGSVSPIETAEGQTASDEATCRRLLAQAEQVSRGSLVMDFAAWELHGRAAWVHEWSLQWHYGPMLDIMVEETFYRQAYIRKWFEKLLDRCVVFPLVHLGNGEYIEPMAHKLVTVDEAMSWASLAHTKSSETPDDDFFERCCEPILAFHRHSRTETRRGSRARSTSVEVSPATSEDDELPQLSSTNAPLSVARATRAVFTAATHRGRDFERPSSAISFRPLGLGTAADSSRLDFKAITDASTNLRQAYEHALHRASCRTNFDRGFSPSADAAKDFRVAVERAQSTADRFPLVSTLLSPPSLVPVPCIDMKLPGVGTDWRPPPQEASLWGEAAVAERLEQLSRIDAGNRGGSTEAAW